MSNSFVTKVDILFAAKMIEDLKEQGFTISKPQYTLFSAKKPGVVCTLYQSGKLMVQGKNKDEFIEFYLEPNILKEFSHSYKELNLDFTSRIGIDESGKGDFFGPLCVAGVFADEEGIKELQQLGVRDSKAIKDQQILEISRKIRSNFTHHIIRINPLKYNELYEKFRNLNRMLAWGHAATIEELVNKTGCKKVIVDQFADEKVVETALERKNLKLDLFQRHRAEEDLVVAAASILARAAFLEGLAKLGDSYNFTLPKGASLMVIEKGKLFLAKYGKEALAQVGKSHFKTLDAILGKAPEWKP